MKLLLCVLCLVSVVVARHLSAEELNLQDQQNRAAKYEFNQDIDDKISDLTHQRNEQRDGLAVKGSYSYSDGYSKRTVHYVADQNGYRVISTDVQPLQGPQIDLSGTAAVSKAAHGTSVMYIVKGVPPGTPLAN